MIRTLLRAIILAIDRALIRRYGIFEFSSNPSSILRVSFEHNKKDRVLSDGFRVAPGEKILAVHLRNEYMPSFSTWGADLGWAKQFLRLFAESLVDLASFIRDDPRCKDIRLIWGTILLFAEPHRMVRRFGFRLERIEGKYAWESFLLFWPRLFAFALIWAFNPRRLKCNALSRGRLYRLYWSRKNLVALTSDKSSHHRRMT